MNEFFRPRLLKERQGRWASVRRWSTVAMVGYGVVWCGVVWCGVVWCGVVWCGRVWCGTIVPPCGQVSFSMCGMHRFPVHDLRSAPVFFSSSFSSPLFPFFAITTSAFLLFWRSRDAKCHVMFEFELFPTVVHRR